MVISACVLSDLLAEKSKIDILYIYNSRCSANVSGRRKISEALLELNGGGWGGGEAGRHCKGDGETKMTRES